MIKILLIILPFVLNAQSLKSILEYATNNNQLVASKEFSQESKQKEVNSRESAYYPTLDIGAFYQSVDERDFMRAGDTYSGFAKLGFDIYDGGSKSALLEQKQNEYKSTSSDLSDVKKTIALQITQNFFGIKSLEAVYLSREEAQKSLEVQLKRMTSFYDAQLATKDDVDRLQSAFDTNIYEMESIKLQILTLKLNLQLQVGREISSLDNSSFSEDLGNEMELVDSIKSLQHSRDALSSLSESVDSVYYPQIRIEDTYSLYGYGNTDALHPEGVDQQNKIMLSANMRLFDNATIKNSKQALEINAQAISKNIEYKTSEQKMQYKLSLATIKTSKIKIKSAESALVSATSAFDTIEKKYSAGIVDNVVYLDALASKTTAASLYETSLNDLQVAYAKYYYYSGKKIEEFLSE